MNGSAPLSGYRVLDLSRILAGPWAGQALAGQQVVGRAPARQGGEPADPGADGRVARGEIVAALFGWKAEITDHRNIGHAGLIADHEGSVLQMPFGDIQAIVNPLLQEREDGLVGRRRKGPKKPVRRHIAGQLVIVPEQPA